LTADLLQAFLKKFTRDKSMRKSKWIELVEWCFLAAIAIFMAGVFLTGSEQEVGRASEVPPGQVEE
jgi:hypothetical protein